MNLQCNKTRKLYTDIFIQHLVSITHNNTHSKTVYKTQMKR